MAVPDNFGNNALGRAPVAETVSLFAFPTPYSFLRCAAGVYRRENSGSPASLPSASRVYLPRSDAAFRKARD